MKEKSLIAKKIIFKGIFSSIDIKNVKLNHSAWVRSLLSTIFKSSRKSLTRTWLNSFKAQSMRLGNLHCATYSEEKQRNKYLAQTAKELNFRILKPLAVSSLSLLVDSDSFIFSIFPLDIKESFSNRSLLKTSWSSFFTKTFFIFWTKVSARVYKSKKLSLHG